MTPTELIERQLEAYNARDLDAFCATYSDSIRIFRMPSTEPAIVGMEKLREVYKARFSSTGLHADIVNRIVIGNKVIDHERVVGIEKNPVEAVAVYEVADDLIQVVWFFYTDKPFPVPKASA
jgi:hypothetical protein